MEPGEIVRPKASTGNEDTKQRVAVVNRKTPSLKITGSKAPTIKNLCGWLDKNPDWDVDPASVELVKSKVSRLACSHIFLLFQNRYRKYRIVIQLE